MIGSIMTLRTALPGMAAGTVGLMSGVLGVAVDQPVLGLVAGGLAFTAGATNMVLARRVDDVMALSVLAASELRSDRVLALGTDTGPDPSTGPGPGTTIDVDAGTERPREDRRRGGGTADLVIDASPTPTPTPTGVTSGEAAGNAAGDEDDADALVDRNTGLFSETFFRVALESRIAAARRHLRPIAVVLLEVVEGLPSGEPKPVDPDLVSATIRSTLREADTACRLRTGYFALLLEDTPENGAIWTVERIRRQLGEARNGLTVWAGVACYPAHAFTPDEILAAAEQALVAAQEWRQDRIEVAVAAD